MTEEHLSSDYATWKKWRLFEPAKNEVGYFEREFGDLPVQPGTKILELGFGSGSLLKWLSAKGADCTGAEIDQTLMAAARRNGFRTENPTDLMESDDVDLYDIVVALDVLEHIPRAELRKYLRRLVDLTRPGGLLVFRFPNSQSPLGLAIQHADITHETALSVPIMEQLIQGLPVQFAAVREMQFPGVQDRFRWLTPLSWMRWMVKKGLLRLTASVIGFPSRYLDYNLVIMLRKKDPRTQSHPRQPDE